MVMDDRIVMVMDDMMRSTAPILATSDSLLIMASFDVAINSMPRSWSWKYVLSRSCSWKVSKPKSSSWTQWTRFDDVLDLLDLEGDF